MGWLLAGWIIGSAAGHRSEPVTVIVRPPAIVVTATPTVKKHTK
jgi:hypothetical protein